MFVKKICESGEYQVRCFFVIFEGQVAIKGETNLGSFAAKLFVSQIFDTLQITAVNKGTTGSVDIC